MAFFVLDQVGAAARVEKMEPARRAQWQERCTSMARMLDHNGICQSLQKRGRLGPLVSSVCKDSGLHRATVYRTWVQLCERGFTHFGLIPQYFRSGAPGVPRPVDEQRRKAGRKSNAVRLGETEAFPQRGITAEDRGKMLRQYFLRMKPGATRASVYRKTIEAAYVTDYDMVGDVPVPQLPAQGSYPSPPPPASRLATATAA